MGKAAVFSRHIVSVQMFGLSILSATVEGPGEMLGDSDSDTAAPSSSASSSLSVSLAS